MFVTFFNLFFYLCIWKILKIKKENKSKEKRKKNIKVYVKLGDTILEQVENVCYLGSIITCENKYEIEIRTMTLAKLVFQNKNNLLENNHINMEIRKNYVKIFVCILTYGYETWTLGKIESKKAGSNGSEGEWRQIAFMWLVEGHWLIEHVLWHNQIFSKEKWWGKWRRCPRIVFFKNIEKEMNLHVIRWLKEYKGGKRDMTMAFNWQKYFNLSNKSDFDQWFSFNTVLLNLV